MGQPGKSVMVMRLWLWHAMMGTNINAPLQCSHSYQPHALEPTMASSARQGPAHDQCARSSELVKRGLREGSLWHPAHTYQTDPLHAAVQVHMGTRWHCIVH